jgi:hypothetical protein
LHRPSQPFPQSHLTTTEPCNLQISQLFNLEFPNEYDYDVCC